MSFNTFIKKLNGTAPMLGVLVDPDKFNPELIRLSKASKVGCFLVGGSKLEKGTVEQTVNAIKKLSDLPVIIFPGDENQLSAKADGVLLLSLLSGRNPEYLIEKHVRAAPIIRKMKLPVLPTAYLLISGNKVSETQKVTKTKPIDARADKILINTSLAAEQLGFKAVYLEAGSGAKTTIPQSLLKKVKQNISVPVIVGGGIDSADKVKKLISAGASMIVVGNALEKNIHLLTELSACFKN